MNWLINQKSCRVTRSSCPSIRASAVVTYEGERYFCFKLRATKLWTLHTKTERLEANTREFESVEAARVFLRLTEGES